LFPKRILVALETPQGTVYTPASGWDRFYLLWTFRNFRSLPQNVLSPRQQQLIGSLYRQTSTGDYYPTNDAFVAGRVENFTPSALSTLPGSTRARKLDSFRGRFGFDRKMTLKFGTAALVLTIAIFAWHELGAQSIVASNADSKADSKSTATVPVARPSERPVAIAKNEAEQNLSPAGVAPAPSSSTLASVDRTSTAPAANLQSAEAPVDHKLAADETARPSPTLMAASKSGADYAPAANAGVAKRSSIGVDTITRRVVQAHVPVVESPGPFEAATDEPRMQISGRPRKLIYPVCPATEARGKVSLQAVVGYDGAVSRIRVLTGDRTLARAAVEAVRQWRYDPFSGAPQAIERETSITISFISSEVVAISFPNSTPLSR
jgi:outer membrane biosynthesis protein TonB